MDVRFLGTVPAGFPSPASDWQERRLALDDLLIAHPLATYFARVSGDSMRDACIPDGAYVVIDRAVTARSGSIIIARLGAEYLIKRLRVQGRTVTLLSAHPRYQPIRIVAGMEFEIWGTITYIIQPPQ